jgi:hypothetical protein
MCIIVLLAFYCITFPLPSILLSNWLFFGLQFDCFIIIYNNMKYCHLPFSKHPFLCYFIFCLQFLTISLRTHRLFGASIQRWYMLRGVSLIRSTSISYPRTVISPLIATFPYRLLTPSVASLHYQSSMSESSTSGPLKHAAASSPATTPLTSTTSGVERKETVEERSNGSVMKSDIISRVEEYVKKELAGNDGSHDWFHIHRVRNLALVSYSFIILLCSLDKPKLSIDDRHWRRKKVYLIP